MVDATRVADLLAASRAAHVNFQRACAHMEAQGGQVVLVPADPVAAHAAVKEAHQFRTQADALDPDHEARAWQDESGTHPHDELMKFYRERLTAS